MTVFNKNRQSDHKAVFENFKLRHESLNNDDVNRNEKPRKYRPWRMNDKILEDKSVIEGVEECKKIKNYKNKYGKLWYDFFISDITNF